MNPSSALYQLLVALIISSTAPAFMPPYDSYFKDKPQPSVERSDDNDMNSLPYSCQTIKNELSDCQSLVAALENSYNGHCISADGEAESKNAANELNHLKRIYSEAQTLLNSADTKLLEAQVEVDSLREALTKAEKEIAQATQARSEMEEKLISLERQLSEERESINMTLEESKREIEVEYGRKFRWQEQRNRDLESTKIHLEKQKAKKETQYEETKAELLNVRYELYNANARLRYLEENIYKEMLLVSADRIVAFLGETKEFILRYVPADQLSLSVGTMKKSLSPAWDSVVAFVKNDVGKSLPPDLLFYQDLVVSNTCEAFDLLFIFFKLQAAPQNVVSISQVLQQNCLEAVLCMEFGAVIIGLVLLIWLVKSYFVQRKI